METNKEKWINEVMLSTQGMTRVKPPSDLFDTIQNDIENKAAIIPLNRLKWVVGVAAVFLFINVIGIQSYLNKDNQLGNKGDISSVETSTLLQEDFVSSYLNYYE